jgi:hypothetical protein
MCAPSTCSAIIALPGCYNGPVLIQGENQCGPKLAPPVGFLTGVYTLFDRFMKGRPLAYLVASGPATNANISLRVKNVGQQDVVLRRLFSSPRLYEIAKDDSVLGITEAQFKSFMTVLQPGQQVDFPVFRSKSGRALAAESRGRCAFVISWRRATSVWLPQIPVYFFTSMHAVEQLKSAYRHPGNF